MDGRSKRPYTFRETERFATSRAQVLSIAYRSTKFSAHPTVSARKIAYDLWYGSGKGEAIKEFEAHYRKVRRAVVDLAEAGLLTKSGTESRPEYAVPGVGDAYG